MPFASLQGIVLANSTNMFNPVSTFYKKYEKWVPLTFFLAGFIFDAYMLRKIATPPDP